MPPSKIPKISISVTIVEKNWFCLKISTISISVKIIQKIVISVHYFRSLNFGQKFWKILISVKNSDNFDYGQNLRMEIHYRSKMRKISISDKIFVRCWYPAKIYFRKNSISVQNFENLDFGQNFRNTLILVQSFDFEKSRFPSNVSKKIWFGPKFQKSLFH